jgi:hypothetical protein
MVERSRHQDHLSLRRAILSTLYDRFKEDPLAEVELSYLETACRTHIKTLNWNIVYLEKKGLVSLSPAVECLPYAACTASITSDGIDLVENGEAFNRLFPMDSDP